jgi:hypothetical protein
MSLRSFWTIAGAECVDTAPTFTCNFMAPTTGFYAALARRMGILLPSSLRSAFQVSYAPCMRTHPPAPCQTVCPAEPLQQETPVCAPAKYRKDVGARCEKSCNLGFCFARGWNHIFS